MKKIRSLLWSSRPISWINTAFPFIAGYLFTQGHVGSTLFWVASIYFLIPYNMLIYVVNDVYDYESDLLNPRKGGVEGALLPRTLHPFLLWSVAICNVPFVAYFATQVHGTSLIILAAVIFDALAYSIPAIRLKERPVFDSISSSFHFVGPLIFALSLVPWKQSFALYCTSFFLWGMASHMFGAVQDIVPDRKAHIRSIATRFGAQTTVRLSIALYAFAILLLTTQGWPEVFVACAALPYLAITWPYRNLTDRRSNQANKGWRHFMRINQLVGFVVTLILIMSLRA